MLIVRLQGGLGNQMFQYAFIRALAYKTGQDFRLDLSAYEEDKNFLLRLYRYRLRNYTKEKYKLYLFNIQEKLATKDELKILNINSHLFLIKKKLKLLSNNIIIEPFPPKYRPEFIEIKDKVSYFIGYFQDEKYFVEIKDIIKKEFTFKREVIDSFSEIFWKWDTLIRSFQNSVAIHIRRGDYVKKKSEFYVCKLEYYKNAIDNFLSMDDVAFFVFSNDLKWVKQNFFSYIIEYFGESMKNKIFVVEGCKSDIEEFQLMKTCSHIIIANSTFSWWAAWLNDNPVKKVICPFVWHLKAPDWHPSSSEWIKVNFKIE